MASHRRWFVKTNAVKNTTPLPSAKAEGFGRGSVISRLDKLGERELKAIAEKNKGKRTLIIVHPFFSRTTFGKKGNKGFENFVKSGRLNKYLVVVFEEWNMVPSLRKRLAGMGLKKSDSLFIVGTKAGMPDPVSGWQKLMARLNAIGAREIIVSGRDLDKVKFERLQHELEVEKKSLARRKLRYSKIRAMKRAAQGRRAYAACAGITWAKLKSSGRFRVRVSRHFS